MNNQSFNQDMIKKILQHSAFKSFTNLGIIQIFTYLAPLIVIPHLYKNIGLENYGLFAFSNSFIFYFIIFIDFGFQLYATKKLAANRENKKYVNKLFTAVMLIKTFFLIFTFLTFIILVHSFSIFKENILLFYLAFSQVVGFYFLPIWIFQGFERIRPLTIINSTSKVVFILSILIFINSKDDILIVQALNSFTILFYGIISFIFAKYYFKIKFQKVSRAFCITIFKKSSIFFASRVATSLYTVTNTVALGLLGGPIDVGIYSVAEKFYFGIQNLLQPITSALYPYIAASKNVSIIKRLIFPSSLFFALGCVIAIIFAPELLSLLITDIDPVTINVFIILVLVLILTFPSLLLGFPVTAALGHDKLANIPLWIVAGLHIILIASCTLVYGISPVKIAYCLLITELTLLIIRIYIVKKYRLFKNG